MESIFENEYERTEKIVKECYKTAYFKRPFFLVMNIILVISALTSLFCSFWEQEDIIYPVFIVIWVCVVFCMEAFVYFRNIKLMIQRDSEQCKGKKPIVRTTVYESELRLENISSGGVSEFEFCSIKKGISTKNLIALITKAKLVMIFSKNGFTKGTAEEFISFLKAKGIKIKKKIQN